MIISLLVSALLVVPFQATDGPTRSSLGERDLLKMSKDLNGYFEALDQDDRGAQFEHLEKIESALGKAAKKAKVDGTPLAYVGDWEWLLEAAKSPGRDLTGQYGKGFFRSVFSDPWDPEKRNIVSLMSVPAAAKKDAMLPAIVVLRESTGDTGKALEESVEALATEVYGPLLETHIVLIPLGAESGSGRRAETAEPEGAWTGDEGMYVLFTALRTLLEKQGFDRSRLVIDGWGEAGLDALRLATTTSFFAGLCMRSSPVEAPDLITHNYPRLSALYLKGEGGADDLGALADVATVVEVDGSGVGPSDDFASWIVEQRRDVTPDSIDYKVGDLRFGSVDWCSARVINRRVTAQPGDDDFPTLKATVDKGSNSIDIETVNVLELMVFLSDELLDLDKPVTIRVNGEEKLRQRTVNRSLKHMLETRFFNNSGDYGLYTASLLVEDIDPNVGG